MPTAEQQERAARLAALGDPWRLAIVDELVSSDRSPSELATRLALPSNLLAHHLDALATAGLVERVRSSGDGRRRYVRLTPSALKSLVPAGRLGPQPALFVCTRNSARSQLAAALWRSLARAPARSAGTHPADRVHPGAVAAARRAGLELGDDRPQGLDQVDVPTLVVTVCDQAHEELTPDGTWRHWSVPDPVTDGRPAAFDAAVAELRCRITAHLHPEEIP